MVLHLDYPLLSFNCLRKLVFGSHSEYLVRKPVHSAYQLDLIVQGVQCVLGWSEIKLLLKSKNFQAYYGSMIIPEQLLSIIFGHRMFHFFLQKWHQRIGIFTL